VRDFGGSGRSSAASLFRAVEHVFHAVCQSLLSDRLLQQVDPFIEASVTDDGVA
jgi:hypothetical protein